MDANQRILEIAKKIEPAIEQGAAGTLAYAIAREIVDAEDRAVRRASRSGAPA